MKFVTYFMDIVSLTAISLRFISLYDDDHDDSDDDDDSDDSDDSDDDDADDDDVNEAVQSQR
ncbi:unnamed protein product [Echinostoma caproni]|uniref:Uncharacterized protein n=1 Tax=Echinostoma caproni TaxID=27848 RepID=A0A3P8IBS1_9TREM|nr:unnamed protein product [Echinostoma caproni]